MPSIFDLSAPYLIYFEFEKVTTVTRGDNSVFRPISVSTANPYTSPAETEN